MISEKEIEICDRHKEIAPMKREIIIEIDPTVTPQVCGGHGHKYPLEKRNNFMDGKCARVVNYLVGSHGILNSNKPVSVLY